MDVNVIATIGKKKEFPALDSCFQVATLMKLRLIIRNVNIYFTLSVKLRENNSKAINFLNWFFNWINFFNFLISPRYLHKKVCVRARVYVLYIERKMY